jgi:hypothetical protein
MLAHLPEAPPGLKLKILHSAPECVYVFWVNPRKTEIISVDRINWLVFRTETMCLLCGTNWLFIIRLNHLNAELNPTCHLLELLGAHHILHVSRIRVNLRQLTLSVKTCTVTGLVPVADQFWSSQSELRYWILHGTNASLISNMNTGSDSVSRVMSRLHVGRSRVRFPAGATDFLFKKKKVQTGSVGRPPSLLFKKHRQFFPLALPRSRPLNSS